MTVAIVLAHLANTSGTGWYTVSDNTIRAPTGLRFVVRGADAVYGWFAYSADSGGYGDTNYANAQRDLGNLAAAGYNFVRIDVSADQYYSTTTPSGATLFSDLQHVVALAEADGLVVELSQEDSDAESNEAAFLGLLARTYKSDPNVWLKMENEPFCGSSICSDWPTWQAQQNALVRTVRSNGYQNPIVLNCIQWSWDCSGYPSYPVSDKNVILGAHRYAHGNSDFVSQDQADVERKWGNLTHQGYAVMVDEFGNDAVGATSPAGSLTWNAGLIRWLNKWTAASGGSGSVAFVDHWSDGNSMTNDDGSFNALGIQDSVGVAAVRAQPPSTVR